MKQLLIAVMLINLGLASGCKKKNNAEPVDPTPDTTSVPTSTACVTGSINLAGKYVYDRCNKDTITIVFNSNMCPKQNSNFYEIRNYYKAVSCISATQTPNNPPLGMVSDEAAKTAVSFDNFTSIWLWADGTMELRSQRLKTNPTYFRKIQ